MLQKCRKREGFTLVEVMAVAAIVSMMTAMALPQFVRMRVHSNEAAAQNNLKSLAQVVLDYEFVNGSPPAAEENLILFVDTYYQGEQSVISNPNLSRDSFEFQGYRYHYAMISPSRWEWTAVPQLPEKTGNRQFTIDASGVVREMDPSEETTITSSYRLGPGSDSAPHSKPTD